MLGLLLIFFIGKSFYKLAEGHEKNKWLYAILGIVSYYIGTFIAGFLIGLYFMFTDPVVIDTLSNIGLSLAVIPFGLLASWGFYSILKKKWVKGQYIIKDEINQIGININDETNKND